MVLPVNRNLNIYQGDSFALVFRLRTRTPQGTTQPINLTGATAKAQIRNKTTEALVVEFQVDFPNRMNGEVRISLTPEQTSALKENARWDVQVSFSDGTVRTYLKGNVTLGKQVTRG